MKKKWIVLLSLLILLVFGCTAYVRDAYPPTADALAAMAGDDRVAVVQDDGLTVFQTETPVAGLLFYPGGKVEPEAYAPLLLALAQRDILCVLIPMPGNLAVLNPDAAQGVAERFPEIPRWYIAGHSLGGSMAAVYAAKHPEQVQGLILLAAYSTADLRDSGLQVLSLYGERDGVLNREKYQANRQNLPADARELIIPGGNHALFGSYGFQKGDGEASISPQAQVQLTADAISSLIP